jgi:CheY-like chemotaxis protein
MAAKRTILCIHRSPADLALLRENGYDLVTARNGSEALRLFMLQSVDAIVLEYYLQSLDGACHTAASCGRKDAPFSAKEWDRIRTGAVRF